MTTFEAQVADWVKGVIEAEEVLFKEATQEVISQAQRTRAEGGRMRVDTGFLRASLMASTSAMPSINPGAQPVEGQKYPYNEAEVVLVINSAELGQTVYAGWTAAYAAHREYGANGQPGDLFLNLAAQRWPAIVNEKAAEIRSRLGL